MQNRIQQRASSPFRSFGGWIASALIAAAGVGQAQQPSQCVVCHEKKTPAILQQHQASVHAKSVTCVACHGGDSTATSFEAGHDVQKGFRGKLTPREATQQCATCHADAAKMKPHSLDSMVVARWQGSSHGKLSEQGDPRAAGCIECHGIHDVRSHRDPESPTNALHVPASCAKCHSDPDKMGSSKLPTDQLNEYLAGAHGKLLSGGDPATRILAPTCVDCHSAHGAKPPDALSVASVCKTCHFEENRFLLGGAHHESLRLTGSPSCVDCHDNHRTTLPKNITETCNRCHEAANDPARAAATRLESIVTHAKSRIEELDHLIADTPQSSETKHRLLLAEHRRIRELHRNLLSVSHSLRLTDLESAVRELDSSIKTIAAVSNANLEESKGFSTPVVIAMLSGIAIVLILLSIILAKLIHRTSNGKPPSNHPSPT